MFWAHGHYTLIAITKQACSHRPDQYTHFTAAFTNHTQYYVLLWGDNHSPMSTYRAFNAVLSLINLDHYAVFRLYSQATHNRALYALTFTLVQSRQDTQGLIKHNWLHRTVSWEANSSAASQGIPFTEPTAGSLCSQEASTWPYAEPHESSAHPPIIFVSEGF